MLLNVKGATAYRTNCAVLRCSFILTQALRQKFFN